MSGIKDQKTEFFEITGKIEPLELQNKLLALSQEVLEKKVLIVDN